MLCRSAVDYSLRLFFFNDTATTEIYTLSLHDALPICPPDAAYGRHMKVVLVQQNLQTNSMMPGCREQRSEEHTSELQSQSNLVCRLLLEKKKTDTYVYDSRHSASLVERSCARTQHDSV